MEENWPSLPTAVAGSRWPPPPPQAAAPFPSAGWAPRPPSPAVTPQQLQPNPKSAEVPKRVPQNGCASSRGVAVAVVDANAVIAGANNLAAGADRLVTVPEVLEEIRDDAARRRLTLTPIPIETLDPLPEFVRKVVKFARETGDLQSLSEVDIKVIALTYMLEAQTHGTSHLRESPPPLREVDASKFPQVDMPGWGSNVPNLSEWEALDQFSNGGNEQGSRILPLKDLNDEVISRSENDYLHDEKKGEGCSDEPESSLGTTNDGKMQEGMEYGPCVSQDENGCDDEGWTPAVSRKSQRRHPSRKSWHEPKLSSKTVGNKHVVADGAPLPNGSNALAEDLVASAGCTLDNSKSELDGLSTSAVLHSLENSSDIDIPSLSVGSSFTSSTDVVSHVKPIVEGNGIDDCSEQLDNINLDCETESVDASCCDDDTSEQSWVLRSLSESTVACATGDYAMQNVILQIGLRLLAPGGMQIRQLHRWVLKCHACYSVTREIGRLFCPKCGNGGTLRKVSVTVNENGVIMAGRRPRIIVRGTKFSLPLPKGGREAIALNPILREDQLPRKMLHPKAKKSSKKDDDYFCSDDVFSNHTGKREPLKPPVRNAYAIFRGRRNPNDNHFSRKKC